MKAIFLSLTLSSVISGTVINKPKHNLEALNIEPVDVAHMRMVDSMTKKEQEWSSLMESGEWGRGKTVLNQRVTCPGGDNGGSVSIDGESFPCRNIDFESFLSISDINIPGNGGSSAGSDIWGWQDSNGREITLMCMDNGVAFIDGTDPANPIRLGHMVSGRPKTSWCDVKVYENYAYVVKDSGGTPSYGIEVFDLTRLESVSSDNFVSFSPDFVYTEHGSSHNVLVDTESGFLYSVGSNTCSGGLHIADLSNPAEPEFVACASSDGYTHDAQCVVYDGPDTDYTGRQICFAYNEDTLTIWDVTNKNNIVRLGRQGYSGSRYTHQGWLSEDMSYVMLNDELDEDGGTVSRTTTYMVDVSDLNNPVFRDTFTSSEVSIDHNLYVWGAIHKKGWGGNGPIAESAAPDSRYMYQSNYVAGIRVLDISNLPSATEVGFFDVAPNFAGNIFEGTWSHYMHPSGTLAVSSIDRGLFFLTPRMAFGMATSAPVVPTPTTPAPTRFPTTAAPTSGCVDLSPSGITVGGVPTECPDLTIYCAGYDFVRERCPVSCNECATVSLATGKSGVLDINESEETDLTSYFVAIAGLGALCAVLAGVLLKKMNTTSEPQQPAATEAKAVEVSKENPMVEL